MITLALSIYLSILWTLQHHLPRTLCSLSARQDMFVKIKSMSAKKDESVRELKSGERRLKNRLKQYLFRI